MRRRDDMIELVRVLAGGPEIGLDAARRLQELLDEELLWQVSEARKASWSWARIGSSLGITRRSVHFRFAWLV